MSQGAKHSRSGLVGALVWLHHQFWREAEAPRDNLFADVDRSFVHAQVLVRCFYAGMLYIAVTQLQRWQLFEQLSPLNALWPVAWVSLVPWQVALYVVLGLFVVGAGLGLVFSEYRWARALAFLGCFQFYALYYSFNALAHRDHAFVLAALMLVLLVRVPQGAQTEGAKRSYLLSFFGVQAMLLLVYMMTGLMKVLISARSFLEGSITSFHLEAMSHHVANVQLQGGRETLIGPLLLQFPFFGFLLFTSVIFFELFAFYVAFRPSLHRPYGAFMVGMHIGIAAAMGLFFSTHLFTTALFLVASPFVPLTFKFWSTLHDVPMVGPFITALRLKLGERQRLAEPGNTLSVYYGEGRFCDRLVYRMLKEPLPAQVFFGTRQSASFHDLRVRYPYLETPDSVVLVSHIEGEERVFVRCEAALIALAASSGLKSYAFILFLLVPPPFLDWGYRLLASRRRVLPTEQQTVPQVLRPERSVDVGIGRVVETRR